MTVAEIGPAKVSQFAIDFIHRDRASLDIDQTMGVATIIADDTVLRMNSDAVTISVGKKRGDDCAQRNIFEFSNSLKNIADLAGFNLELMRVINVLISATATATEVGTRRLDPMRRTVSSAIIVATPIV